MTLASSVLAHVSGIDLYVPGRPIESVAREHGIEPSAIVKLASNENPFGMSPAARQAIASLEGNPSRYPDSDSVALRDALAGHLKQDPQRILIAAGSSELILLAARAFLEPGRAAVMSQYSFISYGLAVRSVGAEAIAVPALDWGHDLKRMLAAIDERVRLVFIASPNNPTGTMLSKEDIERFIAAVPSNVLVVLDEAYREFTPAEHRPDVDKLLQRHDNLLVLRTFSKVYGLAGLRVGYGLGHPDLIGYLKRLQLPFSVTVNAQHAAVAALGDQAFVEQCSSANKTERSRLCAELEARGIRYIPSFGNFVLLHVGDGPKVFRSLVERGIVVRPVANYGLKEWIRVSVGLTHENDAFLRELRAVL
ncbi:histidinol-phosphate transaminase [Steroidobacter flavus]|uniref:Histidinol-phosphate aminotransferase n=1 Tax=Steroidobacter flavus TaxID=1842136 RepID=A0ABV8T3N0_9GAMM